ncbi:hypothetical protein PENSTE_c002G03126 [Penicillium steckii]|uniref:Myb-like domain-containing protein n=1 Tax=Penicillium steckii TaxID=303698 RepID=A0A1V6TTX4_9EURO|nr:hypothetical protein PENSTE_c002G03126 [Penicillium steckii]
MDSNGARRPLEESHHRELPQLSLRIAPLREPVSSRTLSVPSPLEPNASGTRESQTIPKTNATTGSNTPSTTKEGLPTVTEFLNAARTKKNDPTSSSQSSTERLPKPILPAFVNLRALERVPFSSSFDDDALHGQRKRRRLELQAESFSEHLQLPIPQASHKEQRPPPFGPFAILNGLNEPPPNAALLPPIEPGSINQLLTKPTRSEAAAAAAAVDPSSLVSDQGTLVEGQPIERREAKIEELLGSTLNEDVAESVHGDGADPLPHFDQGDAAKSVGIEKEDAKASGVSSGPREGNEPLSPKSRGRSRKNLRKWTEEETIALLHGVVKCGIGNWTTILAQPELKFNKRTASNLKDRFRVCCPWAYRASDPNEAIKKLRDHLADALHKAQTEGSDDTPGKAQFPVPNPVAVNSESSSRAETPTTASHKPSASSMSSSTPDTEAGSISTQKSPPTKFTRTLSDESQSTLESLGIPEPHVAKKSKRRSRNPFTSAEDEALLKGYASHGFQWTLIQQDSRFNLSHRRATDLRDRFRTKFPNAYRHGGSVSNSSINPPKQESVGTPVSMPRDRLPSVESTPTKTAGPSRSGAHSRHPSSASHSNLGPLDSAFLPPPPGFVEPSASNLTTSGILSFPLDETPTGGSSPWEDNTLAPMVWDDLN